MITPYPDQIDFTNKIIRKLAEGYTRVCCQASTGYGKTVVFGYFLTRYFNKRPSGRIIILVHQEELLLQAQKTLKSFNIHNVSVEMVETFNNKIKKYGVQSFQFDVMICDECHRAEFFKVIDHYKLDENNKTIILGFSATPISANKKKPLKNYFQTIVCALPIQDLIKLGRLTQPIHYSPDIDIDNSHIKKSGYDYNMQQMGVEFSKPRLVDGVVDAYKKYADGKKMVIYNSTIEHSRLVNECFLDHGYPSKMIDSETIKLDKNIRKDTLKWLRETPGAIIHNCGILTTGFDDTSIEGEIFNRKTGSLPLWIQCGGRPARIHPGKEYFIIIDLGNNMGDEGFGRWNERHDWEQYFFHPDKVKEGGVAPMKNCPNCDIKIYMSSTKCIWCGHEIPRNIVYSDMLLSLSLVPEGDIKRNSHKALMDKIQVAAHRIMNVPIIRLNERKELMFYAFKELYERSSFEPKTHVITHLVSLYAK